jgi:hypothetical protein
MEREAIVRFRRVTGLWFAGGLGLPCATWARFRLGLDLAASAFIDLISVVPASPLDWRRPNASSAKCVIYARSTAMPDPMPVGTKPGP